MYFRLGLAYAGSNRDDVLQLILPVLGDSKASMEVRFEPPHGKNQQSEYAKTKTQIIFVVNTNQLRGNREADQRLCFRYSDSTIPLLLKSEISRF